jgi:monoamine oxidase
MAEHTYDVVVVGAGFAGAAAASVLQKAGYRTAVLEARDRAGGRA